MLDRVTERTAALKKLRSPATLAAAVGGQLRDAIMSGALAPGTMITEGELVLRLGVSATPVREALLELAGEGLVEVEPNRHKRVTPIDRARMIDLVQVQTALWRLGYQWGVPHVGDAELAALAEALDRYARAAAAGDLLTAILAGQSFHSIVIAAARNAELLRVTLDRRALIARFVLLCGPETVSRAGLAQHRAIMNALAAREPDEALMGLDRLAARLIGLTAHDNDYFAAADPPNV